MMAAKKQGLNRLAIGLGGFQILLSIGALAGGYNLIADPTGASLGWALNMLDGTPFPDFLFPGYYLFSIIGIGHLIAAILTFFKSRFAGEAAIFLGVVLVSWIIAQVFWIGLNFWLQPLYFVFGLVEILLGLRFRKKLFFLTSTSLL